MTDIHNPPGDASTVALLRRITGPELAVLGIEAVAFVKPIEIAGKEAFAVLSAAGETLGVAPAREIAHEMIRQNELQPVSVH
jgi:hypothetical protein